MSAWDRRRFLSGAGVLAVGGLLAACGSEESAPPAVSTGPKYDGKTPAVTTDQMDDYLAAIHKALKKADESANASDLKPRITGSAASFRKDTYAIIEKEADWAKESLDRPGSKPVVPITSTGTEFPRTALALVEPDGEGEAAPYFMVLQQSDAHAVYSTWGWAQQVAGVDMPTVPSAEVGSTAVDASTDDLMMTPKAALALYADVLANGGKAKNDEKIALDPFRTSTQEQIQQERKELNSGVDKDEVGTIHEDYSPVKDEIAGLHTDDGGAIVLGTLTSKRTVTIKPGAKVSYAKDNVYTRIIGTRTFTSEYVREYGTTVALYIPAKGSDAKVQPIGATRTVLDAHGE